MTRNTKPSTVALLRAVAPDADRAAVAVDCVAPLELAESMSAKVCAVARVAPARAVYPRVIRQKVR